MTTGVRGDPSKITHPRSSTAVNLPFRSNKLSKRHALLTAIPSRFDPPLQPDRNRIGDKLKPAGIEQLGDERMAFLEDNELPGNELGTAELRDVHHVVKRPKRLRHRFSSD